jgi:hypothetical protein
VEIRSGEEVRFPYNRIRPNFRLQGNRGRAYLCNPRARSGPDPLKLSR